VTESYLPTEIRRMSDDLTADTGQTPTITRNGPLHYELHHANERVTLTITWRRSPAGKWKWKHSTLAIDGHLRAIAKDYVDFIRIWHAPDEADAKPAPTILPTLTPVDDSIELPSLLTVTRDTVLNRTKDVDDFATYIAKTDAGYALVADGPKGHIRIHYAAGRTDQTWRLDPRQPFQVLDAEGIDQTAQFGGDLEAALRAFLDTPTAEPISTPKARGPYAAATTNSVTVRRHSVIRV
jgi:hypothetical protein